MYGKDLKKAFSGTFSEPQALFAARKIGGEPSRLKAKTEIERAGSISGVDKGDFNKLDDDRKVNLYISNILNTVSSYRQAGFTDQEILKMMQ